MKNLQERTKRINLVEAVQEGVCGPMSCFRKVCRFLSLLFSSL
jgi:hypothetical protein